MARFGRSLRLTELAWTYLLVGMMMKCCCQTVDLLSVPDK
jgi:hypothetical protein